MQNSIHLTPVLFSSAGPCSKEETFIDKQVWLDPWPSNVLSEHSNFLTSQSQKPICKMVDQKINISGTFTHTVGLQWQLKSSLFFLFLFFFFFFFRLIKSSFCSLISFYFFPLLKKKNQTSFGLLSNTVLENIHVRTTVMRFGINLGGCVWILQAVEIHSDNHLCPVSGLSRD